MKLNRKQTKTLERIYESPTRSDIKWTDILNLLKGCGAQIFQRKGSRVCIMLDKHKAVFHEPHPRRVTVKGAVEDIKEFLRNAKIKP